MLSDFETHPAWKRGAGAEQKGSGVAQEAVGVGEGSLRFLYKFSWVLKGLALELVDLLQFWLRL